MGDHKRIKLNKNINKKNKATICVAQTWNIMDKLMDHLKDVRACLFDKYLEIEYIII